MRQKNWFIRGIVVNLAAFVVWGLLSYGLFHVQIHYGAQEREPWSLESTGTVNANEGSGVVQEVQFTDFTMLTAYLKSVSTILVNLPDDKNDGILHVELSEDGSVLCMADVAVSDIEAGTWFDIPMGCVVALNHIYQITYTMQDNTRPSRICWCRIPHRRSGRTRRYMQTVRRWTVHWQTNTALICTFFP